MVMPPAFHVIVKPRGAVCNLNCQYCYYLPKERLYPGSGFLLADELLDRFTQQYIAAQRVPQATFVWQGGEPMTGTPSYRYRAAIPVTLAETAMVARDCGGVRCIDRPVPSQPLRQPVASRDSSLDDIRCCSTKDAKPRHAIPYCVLQHCTRSWCSGLELGGRQSCRTNHSPR